MRRVLTIARAVTFFTVPVACWANVGIVVYESKGADARRTSTGHVALVATGLCPAGIDHLKRCAPDEEPGAVVTRYANVASGYDNSLFIVPLRDHFYATQDADAVPVLSSGGTLEAMQMEYWRLHLKPYLPPLTEDQYQEMRKQLDAFDAGRTFRRAITMDYLIALLGPHKKKYPTEPIAIIHPVTKEMIPNGRWRESIGVSQMRSSVIITSPASVEQEEQLLRFVNAGKPPEFQAMTDNCSDYVAAALVATFGGAGMRLRPRMLHVADAWITSPIAVATDFLNFAKRERVPLSVATVPMQAGTRRPTAAITSISRGALVPDASQGKMAFAMKVYFNTLNPLLGILSLTADQASRFANLQDLVHDRGNRDLSRISNSFVPADTGKLKREQFRLFGTAGCWQVKRDQFARMGQQAVEKGLLSPVEGSLLLKQGRPYLLPRSFEQTAAAHGSEGALMAALLPEPMLPLPGFVPGRKQVSEMADSSESEKRTAAYKLMLSVINYDLSSEPVTRRVSEDFDPDWRLYMDIARKNDIHSGAGAGVDESLADCSCREFDSGTAKTDSFQRDRSVGNKLAREGRGLLYGANR
ncbi:MAG: hypothetical protein M3Z09_16775 [Acidobacteriota bacterium]|nr:hypothetical protein [Acidobacteriota bacterium]